MTLCLTACGAHRDTRVYFFGIRPGPLRLGLEWSFGIVFMVVYVQDIWNYQQRLRKIKPNAYSKLITKYLYKTILEMDSDAV